MLHDCMGREHTQIELDVVDEEEGREPDFSELLSLAELAVTCGSHPSFLASLDTLQMAVARAKDTISSTGAPLSTTPSTSPDERSSSDVSITLAVSR